MPGAGFPVDMPGGSGRLIILRPTNVDGVFDRALIAGRAIQIMPGELNRFQFNQSGINNELYVFT